MTAPPTFRQIITTPRETLWWSASVLLVGWAILYSSGYVIFGGSAAGPAYYVIAHTMGVRQSNVITLVLGLAMLGALVTRSCWTAMTMLAFSGWCTWMAIAMYGGYANTGQGWGGGPTWTFFTLFGLLWYVASPLMMRGVPGHPRTPRTDTPVRAGWMRHGANPRTGPGAA